MEEDRHGRLVARLKRVWRKLAQGSRSGSVNYDNAVMADVQTLQDCTCTVFVRLISRLFKISLSGDTPSAQLQHAIDYLASSVIGMPLDHIRVDAVGAGDVQTIEHLLAVVLDLSDIVLYGTAPDDQQQQQQEQSRPQRQQQRQQQHQQDEEHSSGSKRRVKGSSAVQAHKNQSSLRQSGRAQSHSNDKQGSSDNSNNGRDDRQQESKPSNSTRRNHKKHDESDNRKRESELPRFMRSTASSQAREASIRAEHKGLRASNGSRGAGDGGRRDDSGQGSSRRTVHAGSRRADGAAVNGRRRRRVDSGGSGGGGEVDAFVRTFQSLCEGLLPFVLNAYESAGDMTAYADPSTIESRVSRVCSVDSAHAVLHQFCAHGRMPDDVTATTLSTQQRSEDELAAGATEVHQRSRRSTDHGSYTCFDGCNTDCVMMCSGCDGDSCDICSTTCTGSCDEDCKCNPGYHGSGTTCYNCADNYYSTEYNSNNCMRCDDCPEEHQYRAGCSRGTALTPCVDCGTCEKDEYRVGCRQGEEGNCRPCYGCQAGRYRYNCGGFSIGFCVTCGYCPPGQFRDGCIGTSPGTCKDCQPCPAGYQREGCTGTSGGTCEPCPEGTWRHTYSTYQCFDCQACSSGYERVYCGGSSSGSCRGILCDAAPTVAHATVHVTNGRRYQSTATYTCGAGYELKNANRNSLSCATDGSWSGTLPECVGVACPPISLTNGDVSPSGTIRYPDSASLSCHVGYVLQGGATQSCQADGTWSFPDPPSCQPLYCSPVTPPENGAVSYSNGRRYPSTATFTCNSGYVLEDGDAEHTCSATTHVFVGETPKCLRPTCPALPPPTHGSGGAAANTLRYPAAASFSCDTGYVLMGPATVQCKEEGTWATAAPTCIGRLCTKVTTPENGRVTYSNARRYPSTATYTCTEGYEVVGAATRQCQADKGEFDGVDATCRGKLCQPLSAPANGTVTFTPRSFNPRYPATATFACLDGYVRIGASTAECDADTAWSAQPPRCQLDCDPGYVKSGGVCVDDNECFDGTHSCDMNAACTNTAGSYTCACNDGYEGDGFTCDDVDECVQATHGCDVNAACTNTIGSYTCACVEGYEGDGRSCHDEDECADGTHSCHEEATCTNSVGSYTCACNSGFTGSGFTCEDVDECMEGTHDCDVNAACTNTIGSYTCACVEGYEGDGVLCRDEDECVDGTARCAVNATCTNTVGSYTCACNSGFTGSGLVCDDVDECMEGTHDCDVNAVCTNTIGSYTCACQTGYRGDGFECEDRNECLYNTAPCHAHAACTNTDGSFVCTCERGYAGDGIAVCDDVDECALGTHNCAADATCFNSDGSFRCVCNSGFRGNGTACADVDECVEGTAPCDANATCTNTPGSFLCTCVDGFAGTGIACVDVDECRQETHECDPNARCTNTDGGYTCTCRDGFVGDGLTCADVDECAASNAAELCHANATCTNTAGSFACECSAGFVGDGVRVCSPQPSVGQSGTSASVDMAIPVSIVGGVIGVVFIAAAVVFIVRRRRQAAADAAFTDGNAAASSDGKTGGLFKNPLFSGQDGMSPAPLPSSSSSPPPHPAHAWNPTCYDVNDRTGNAAGDGVYHVPTQDAGYELPRGEGKNKKQQQQEADMYRVPSVQAPYDVPRRAKKNKKGTDGSDGGGHEDEDAYCVPTVHAPYDVPRRERKQKQQHSSGDDGGDGSVDAGDESQATNRYSINPTYAMPRFEGRQLRANQTSTTNANEDANANATTTTGTSGSRGGLVSGYVEPPARTHDKNHGSRGGQRRKNPKLPPRVGAPPRLSARIANDSQPPPPSSSSSSSAPQQGTAEPQTLSFVASRHNSSTSVGYLQVLSENDNGPSETNTEPSFVYDPTWQGANANNSSGHESDAGNAPMLASSYVVLHRGHTEEVTDDDPDYVDVHTRPASMMQ